MASRSSRTAGEGTTVGTTISDTLDQSSYQEALNAGCFNKETREICPGFSIEEGDEVLDIGCGNEAVSIFCADIGAKLLLSGSDRPTMERMVKKIRQSAPWSYRVFLSDNRPVPLQSQRVSKVVLLDILQRQ